LGGGDLMKNERNLGDFFFYSRLRQLIEVSFTAELPWQGVGRRRVQKYVLKLPSLPPSPETENKT